MTGQYHSRNNDREAAASQHQNKRRPTEPSDGGRRERAVGNDCDGRALTESGGGIARSANPSIGPPPSRRHGNAHFAQTPLASRPHPTHIINVYTRAPLVPPTHRATRCAPIDPAPEPESTALGTHLPHGRIQQVHALVRLSLPETVTERKTVGSAGRLSRSAGTPRRPPPATRTIVVGNLFRTHRPALKLLRQPFSQQVATIRSIPSEKRY